MKLLSLMAAGLLLAVAPQVHAQTAKQSASKPVTVASTQKAHAAPATEVAQQGQVPADTTRKAHKSTRHAKSGKVASASRSGRARHTAKAGTKGHMKARADTAKKGS